MQVLCKSVFRDGRAETTGENFTLKLAELIDRAEADRQALAGQSSGRPAPGRRHGIQEAACPQEMEP